MPKPPPEPRQPVRYRGPESDSGLVEGIRVIFVARRGAVQARTAAINTLHQMIITAPMRLRDQLNR